MSVLRRLRQYHALLGILVILAYVSGEWGLVHAWLGYGVALLIFVRLIFALSGAPQLGLFRFYPQFTGLRLGNALTHPAISRTLLVGIAVCVIGVTGTGIAMDKGHSLGITQAALVATAMADDGRRDARREGRSEVLEDLHEGLANLLILLVVLHVVYLALFKTPLAAFMLFLRDPSGGPK
jgi:cytochrome b